LSLLDINLETLEKTRDELLLSNRESETKNHALQVLILRVDVTDETAVTNAVQETVKRFGCIDIAINAAGVGDVGMPTHEVPVSDWKRIIEVDQMGTWFCQRAVIQQMLKQESV
jgi:NAD(P)-dependent dehydrogenase (short-subunit alcohol dehydrogenase family)